MSPRTKQKPATKGDTPTIVNLPVPFRAEDRSMYLRTSMADAATEYRGVEYKIDVGASVNGACIIVGVREEGRDGWVNYVVTTESLIRAVMDHHLATTAKAAVSETPNG